MRAIISNISKSVKMKVCAILCVLNNISNAAFTKSIELLSASGGKMAQNATEALQELKRTKILN